jgi:hypothetical protein
MELILKEIPDEYENNEKLWVFKENKELFNKYNQIEIPKETIKSSIITSTTKQKKETPLELIIKYTYSNDKMKQEIKQKLIEFITIPEFSKAFGVKKAAEVISAITRDSWNQSTALFISFLLDSNIIYKDKSYLYNKDKNKNEIVIVC